MKVLKHPIPITLLFLAIGILLDYLFMPSLPIVLCVTITAAVSFVTAYLQAKKSLLQKPYFLLATCLLSVSIGMLTHWLHYEPNHRLHYTNIIKNEEIPIIQGIISERLKPNDYYEKYYFKIQSIDRKPALGQILLSAPKDSIHKRLHAGDVLIIVDTLKPITKSLNPYQFDYSEYMAKQNVFHQMTLKDNYVAAGKVKNFDYYLGSLRSSLINSFRFHHYPVQVNNIINALLLGQRQDMDNKTINNYTDAGVIHILAISGLHFATLFYIFNLLLTPLKRMKREGEIGQLILILMALWSFAFITGLSASVVRSVVMFSFVGIGRCLNRNTSIMHSIAVSMLVLLIAKPNFLFDVGFQLSYASVFAIVWLQPLYSRIRISKYKAVNYLLDTIVISLVAQIGVLPLCLYYFNQFPLLFLIANVIVIPLSTVVLILALAVLILNFTVPSLALLLGKLLSTLITVMNSFIEWIASFKSLLIKDISFTILLNISLYIFLILTVRLLYKKTFARLAAVLIGFICFQTAYLITSLSTKHGKEMVLFNNKKNTLLAIKDNNRITTYSNDSMTAENPAIKAYKKENFNPQVFNLPLKNILWFEERKILLIDSSGVYPVHAKPHILMLSQSPKINLERALEQLKPKEVVADATNYKSYISRWRTTCNKLKIPFHSTTQKGFYKLD